MNDSFGGYLMKLRQSKKMSIRKLAMKSGVSAGYISNIETGKRNTPTPDSIKKLSQSLNVTYEEMMIQAGYMREQKDAVYELSSKLLEVMKESKKIDLTEFDDYEFQLDGKPVSKEYMEKVIMIARQFLPPSE